MRLKNKLENNNPCNFSPKFQICNKSCFQCHKKYIHIPFHFFRNEYMYFNKFPKIFMYLTNMEESLNKQWCFFVNISFLNDFHKYINLLFNSYNNYNP